MGKIGRKLSNILSKDKGRAKNMYELHTDDPTTHKHTDRGIDEIPVAEFIPNTFQPRKTFEQDKLEELAKSIKKKGVIQHIIYRTTEKGNEIIAGERRWRAAQIAGLRTVPAREMDVTDEEALELAIIENIQRDDLNPIEKGLGFKMLMDSYNLTQENVAETVGISRTAVANFIRLLNLPSKVKEYVSRETLTMGHARCLLSLSNPEKQISLAEKIIKQGLSVRQVEDIIYGSEKQKRKKKAETPKDPHIAELENRFKQALGAKTTIKNRKIKGTNKGSIIIKYHSNEDFNRIADKIGVEL